MSVVYGDMMTALSAHIQALPSFSDKRRIANPYSIESNPVTQLKDGWGLGIGTTTVNTTHINTLSTTQVYFVVLSRQINGSESTSSVVDREVANLLNDAQTLSHSLSDNVSFTLPNDVWDIHLSQIGGIEYLDDDKNRFITTTIEFNVRVEEQY